jgi:hypothetical protein
MATRRKTKTKIKAPRKKKPANKATRRRKKTIRRKVTKKAPLRAASPKKASSTKAPLRAASPTKTTSAAKTTGKPAPIGNRASEASAQRSPARPISSEQRVGVVTHYYGHLSVVAMQLEPGASLRVGDVIHIRGHTTDFTQSVESLEVNRASVSEVGPSDDFGLKVIDHARAHDVVFKVGS